MGGGVKGRRRRVLRVLGLLYARKERAGDIYLRRQLDAVCAFVPRRRRRRMVPGAAQWCRGGPPRGGERAVRPRRRAGAAGPPRRRRHLVAGRRCAA